MIRRFLKFYERRPNFVLALLMIGGLLANVIPLELLSKRLIEKTSVPADAVIVEAKSDILATQTVMTVVTLFFVVALFVVIGHLRKVKDKLAATAQQATANSVAKSEFLSSVSHEIRNPMNSIVGMADLLGETSLDDVQERFVKGITTASDSMLKLINDVLDISKIEAGGLEIEKTNFNLEELLDSVVDIMGPRVLQKRVELVIHLDPKINPEFLGDPTRITQILINLLGNAVKFTKEGVIELKVELSDQKGNLHNLRFAVLDSGVGIPEKALATIFQKFTQAETSTTRKYGGTGLGLSISKKLVEMMGGTIGVTSQMGQGSTFFFELRLEANPATRQSQDDEKVLKNLRVLLVDDQHRTREALSSYLSFRGANVAQAPSGSEGLGLIEASQAQGDPFELVLIDNEMPQMSGLSVIERLNEFSRDQRPAILLLTGLDQKVNVLSQRQSLEISGFLTKPVKIRELRKALTTVLSSRHTRATTPQRNSGDNRVLVVDPATDSHFCLKDIVDLYYEHSLFIQDPSEVFNISNREKICAVVVNGSCNTFNCAEFFFRIRENSWMVPMLLVFPQGNQLNRLAIGWDHTIQFFSGEIPHETFYQYFEKVISAGLNRLEAQRKNQLTQSFKLLVVDDSEDNQILMKAYLRPTPCQVATASSGEAALQLLTAGARFDLILMDLQMPQMDGYETVEKIRALEQKRKNRRIPIVALSGLALKTEIQKCFDVGFDGHLAKPIKKQQILHLIYQFTQPAEQNSESAQMRASAKRAV